VTELSENPGLNATGPPALGDIDAESWAEAVAALRSTPARPPPPPWDLVFGPLARGAVDDLLVIGQIGQSLDGRIATPTGHSHYVNGEDGLVHLHRLRALVDAVVVGISTVVADDPQLTVRRVAGPQPARVVIDPKGRLPANARALAMDGMRRLVIIAAERQPSLPTGVEAIALDNSGGDIEPAAILGSLAQRGLRRILVEGGARTISRFLAAGCLDRLHVVVAPVILGAGPAGIALPPIERMDEALRPRVQAHMLGDEVLFDCDLSAQRVPIGRAKKSR
jgi:diaminohydroxyphosphoribosylaminopyrimidine deaminase/5-amino-6-(5-phosphoribosylamino)uracil reductase